jgi:hypothetical protein
MPDPSDFESQRQAIADDASVRMLSVFFWVSGAVTGLLALYFLIYVAFGVVVLMTPVSSSAGDAFPGFFGWMFAVIGVLGFGFATALALVKVMCGFWLRQRRHRVVIMVVAGLACLEFPWGTLLGVMTFMLMARPSVAEEFAR